MDSAVRVGVVGCGIGKQHIEGFKSLPGQFEVTAICDVDEAKAREGLVFLRRLFGPLKG